MNTSKGFDPIGEDSSAFTGTFDGQGHTIKGLVIDRAGENVIGLFGNITDATVQNLELKDTTFTGKQGVAALVGIVTPGTHSNRSSGMTWKRSTATGRPTARSSTTGWPS